MTPTPYTPETGTTADGCSTQSSWSAKDTAGFGFLILIVFFTVQVGSVMAFASVSDIDLRFYSGLALGVAVSSSSILCTAAVVFLLHLRRILPVKQHLALVPVSAKTMIAWIFLLVVLVMIGDQITISLGRPVVPDVIADAYRTAYYVPLFWLAVVVGAPLFEEVFFRGFLFEGFSRSRLGVPGTVLLTTIIWTIIHQQYDPYELSLVFTLGIFLAVARVCTGSLYVPLTLHAIVNFIATIQTMILLSADGR